MEIRTAYVEILLQNATAAAESAASVAERKLRVFRQKLRHSGGGSGGRSARDQAVERIGYGSVQRGNQGRIAHWQRTQVLARNAIDLSQIDGSVNRMVADVH